MTGWAACSEPTTTACNSCVMSDWIHPSPTYWTQIDIRITPQYSLDFFRLCGESWEFLMTSGHFLGLLWTFVGILGTYGDFRGTKDNSLGLFETCKDSLGLLGTSKESWGVLGTPDYSWINMGTCGYSLGTQINCQPNSGTSLKCGNLGTDSLCLCLHGSLPKNT